MVLLSDSQYNAYISHLFQPVNGVTGNLKSIDHHQEVLFLGTSYSEWLGQHSCQKIPKSDDVG